MRVEDLLCEGQLLAGRELSPNRLERLEQVSVRRRDRPLQTHRMNERDTVSKLNTSSILALRLLEMSSSIRPGDGELHTHAVLLGQRRVRVRGRARRGGERPPRGSQDLR
jgi:hypothetical protein